MKFLLKYLRSDSSIERYKTANDNLRTFVAVGYPKVGNTWLRMTLGRYLQNVYGLPDMPLMDSEEFPSLQKAGAKALGEFTHYPLEWNSQTANELTNESTLFPFQDQRVVLLIRHPLDVLVSLYMQERYRNKSTPFSGTLLDFIQHPVYGLDKFLKFYKLWAKSEKITPNLHLWRYEDAQENPIYSLERLLRFLGEPINIDAVTEAVNFASFDNLKAIEQSGKRDIVYKSSGLFVFGSEPNTNPNALHVRKGVVGGYKDELSPEDVGRFEAQIRSEMPLIYGYT